eukprot:11890125-Prorocentrum_lima.AAC.1
MRRTIASLHRARRADYVGEWDLEPVYRQLQIWLNDTKVWTGRVPGGPDRAAGGGRSGPAGAYGPGGRGSVRRGRRPRI